MRGWPIIAAASLSCVILAGCGEEAAGKRAIVEACLKGGQRDTVCACLASEASKRLDRPMFNVIVLGAEGNAAETDRIMASLTASAAQRFAATTQDIARTCGASAPATGPK